METPRFFATSSTLEVHQLIVSVPLAAENPYRFTISSVPAPVRYFPMNQSVSPRLVLSVNGRARRPRASGDQGIDPTPKYYFYPCVYIG